MNLLKRHKMIELFLKFEGLLTQVQRQAMHLYYIEDLSLSEIAAIVASTRSAVYDAIKKAEQKLITFYEKVK